MAGEADDTSWLDTPSAEDEWLRIEDPNAGKTTRAFQVVLESCIRGTNRVMACDGNFMAYRPFNREFDKEVNPRTKERFNDFIAAGFFTHIGTYDEVQIYRLEEGSPFKQKGDYVIGTDYWKDIRSAAKAACAREWSDYHDILGAMAQALKAGRDPAFAKQIWTDALNQVAITIGQMKGPSFAEVNAGFQSIRQKRGISKGSVIATLSDAGLTKVALK